MLQWGMKHIDWIFILFSTILANIVRLAFIQSYLADTKFTLGQHIIAASFTLFVSIFFWFTLKAINTILNKVYPYSRNIFGRMLLQMFVGISILLLFRFTMYITFESGERRNSMPFVDILSFIVNILMVIAVNLGYFGAYFFEQFQHAQFNSEKLLREQSEVKFNNLKNQLNPHFLFNSLTSLNSLIDIDQKLAQKFLQQLSKVYRYVLSNKENVVVSLETESEFISNYISLLETRFSQMFQVLCCIRDEDRDKGIIPVTLQILIENAVKHNLMSEAYPLIVKIYTDGKYCIVENNVQRKKIVETSNKIGLNNMVALYSYMTELPVDIQEISDTFRVKVPLIEI